MVCSSLERSWGSFLVRQRHTVNPSEWSTPQARYMRPCSPRCSGAGKSAETSATFPSGLQAYWKPTSSTELTLAAEEAEGSWSFFLAPTGISIRPFMLRRQQRALQILLLSECQTWWFTVCSPCVEMWSAQTCSFACPSPPSHAPFSSPSL